MVVHGQYRIQSSLAIGDRLGMGSKIMIPRKVLSGKLEMKRV